jgi:hypothetical protein
MEWKDRIADFERRNPDDESGPMPPKIDILRQLEEEGAFGKPDSYDIMEARDGAYLHWFGISEDDCKFVGYSEVYHSLIAINRAAFEAAKRPDGTLDEGRYISLQYDGTSVIQSIWSNLRWPKDKERKGKSKQWLWSHRESNFPEFNRTGIEPAVGEYLALPYRVPKIDRLLVDLLLAMEMAAYTKEARGRLISLLVNALFLGLGALAWWHEWPLAGGITALVSIVWMLFPLQFLIRAKTLIEQMHRCYEALSSDGPISARHVRDLLARATEKGVVWPAPIYPLLDDVIARGGVL